MTTLDVLFVRAVDVTSIGLFLYLLQTLYGRRIIAFLTRPIVWMLDRTNYHWRCKRCGMSFYFAKNHVIWIYAAVQKKAGVVEDLICYGGALCEHCHWDIDTPKRLKYWQQVQGDSGNWSKIADQILLNGQ